MRETRRRAACFARRSPGSGRTCVCCTRALSRSSSRRRAARADGARDAEHHTDQLSSSSSTRRPASPAYRCQGISASHRLAAGRSRSSLPRPRGDAAQRHPPHAAAYIKDATGNLRDRLHAGPPPARRRRRVHHRGELDALARAAACDTQGTFSGLQRANRRADHSGAAIAASQAACRAQVTLRDVLEGPDLDRIKVAVDRLRDDQHADGKAVARRVLGRAPS